MNWYKTSQAPQISILSYNNMGDLNVLIGDKRYKYVGVEVPAVEKLRTYLKYNNIKKAFELLRSFKQEKELFEKNLFD